MPRAFIAQRKLFTAMWTMERIALLGKLRSEMRARVRQLEELNKLPGLPINATDLHNLLNSIRVQRYTQRQYWRRQGIATGLMRHRPVR